MSGRGHSLRIGFIGNQNNYPFILARALRRAGHDVQVVIDQPHMLDRPECRYSDIPYPYPDWIHETDPIELHDVVYGTAPWRRALDLVRDCDALVLNQWGYDAASRLGLPAFCLTTGADVEHWSCPQAAEAHVCHAEQQARGHNWFKAAFAPRPLNGAAIRDLLDRAPGPLYRTWRKHVFRRFAHLQRAGLRRAVAINAFPDGVSERLRDAMQACLRPDTKRLCLMMADSNWIAPAPAPDNRVLRLFNGSRILWKQPFPPGVGAWENKGTDVLLRGIALRHRRSGAPIDVRLAEKGPSVAATKRLIDELGIAPLVTWQAELTQAAVFREYALADVVGEQCGSHVLGMAAYEAMAMGRPVLANGRPELFTAVFGAVPPVAQARTPEEVAAQLARLAEPEQRAQLGREGRRFVERHLSPDAAAATVAAVLAEAIAERGGTTSALSRCA